MRATLALNGLNTSLWMWLLLVSFLKNGFYQSGFTRSLPEFCEELFQRTIMVTYLRYEHINTKHHRAWYIPKETECVSININYIPSLTFAFLYFFLSFTRCIWIFLSIQLIVNFIFLFLNIILSCFISILWNIVLTSTITFTLFII